MEDIRIRTLNFIRLLLLFLFVVANAPAQTVTESVLHSFSGFPTDGVNPYAGLIFDSAGNLYGTTSNGGANGSGTVFKLDTSNNLTLLHSFSYADGAHSNAGLIFDSAGNLYGATASGGAYGNGIVFMLDTSNNLTMLHSFSGADGIP